MTIHSNASRITITDVKVELGEAFPLNLTKTDVRNLFAQTSGSINLANGFLKSCISSFTASTYSTIEGNGVYLYPVFYGLSGSINQGLGTVSSGSAYIVYPAVGTTVWTLTSGGSTATVSISAIAQGCSYDCVSDACGCCPAPNIPILMADNTYKLAEDIQVGDNVITWNGMELDIETVSAVENGFNHRFSIVFDNNQEGLFAFNHKFLTSSYEWVELRDLKPGDTMSTGVKVVNISEETYGPVIKITVNKHHSFMALGVISHNYLKHLTYE